MTHLDLRKLIYLSLTMMTIACSVSEKPTYYINDTLLREYQGGDKLSYTVLDDSSKLKTYSVTLESREEFEPINTSSTVNLLFEQQNTSDNFVSPFIPLLYEQNAEGDLFIKAVSSSGEILWLTDSDNTLNEEIFYPADISQLQTNQSFTKKLIHCNDDKECTNAGQFELHYLQLLETETVETPYAIFEAYKIKLSMEVTINITENASDTKFYSFQGFQWIYPPLGVIDFVYDNVRREVQSSVLIGDLSATNISLAESLKINVDP